MRRWNGDKFVPIGTVDRDTLTFEPPAPPKFVKASEIMVVDKKVLDRLPDGILDEIDAIHAAPERPESKITRVEYGGKAKSKGGHFTPAAPFNPETGKFPPKPRKKKGESFSEFATRENDWYSLPRRPQIRLNDGGVAGMTYINSFLHEYGHSLDWQEGTKKGQTIWTSGVKDLPGSVEMADLIDTVKGHEHFKDGMSKLTKYGTGYVTYLRDRREVWARTYAQYMQQKLGGEALAELETGLANNGILWQNFPTDVFETEIAPKVEAVLKSQGLMNDV